ncbi:twin-arginine translocase TatA/TatE family subunit [Chloroflexota bacterium]
MDFFGMGMGEILLILVVALIIWGPGKIPEIARTLGKTIRAFRKATSDLTTVMTKELSMEEKDRPPQSKANNSDKAKEPSDADTAEPKNEGPASS